MKTSSILLLLMFLTSCNTNTVHKNQEDRISSLEKRLLRKEKDLQDLKIKNQALQALKENNIGSFKKNSVNKAASLKKNILPAAPNLSEELQSSSNLGPLTISEIHPSAYKNEEEELYLKFTEKYRSGRPELLIPLAENFITRYPRSDKADQVLYMVGKAQLTTQNYAQALTYFNRTLEKYPTSHKAVSALYAKAITFDKLKLKEEARKLYHKVLTNYPGSPEALKAGLTLKAPSEKTNESNQTKEEFY